MFYAKSYVIKAKYNNGVSKDPNEATKLRPLACNNVIKVTKCKDKCYRVHTTHEILCQAGTDQTGFTAKCTACFEFKTVSVYQSAAC